MRLNLSANVEAPQSLAPGRIWSCTQSTALSTSNKTPNRPRPTGEGEACPRTNVICCCPC
eukprot:9177373-Pyramimonas_sp.AAC.1